MSMSTLILFCFRFWCHAFIIGRVKRYMTGDTQVMMIFAILHPSTVKIEAVVKMFLTTYQKIAHTDKPVMIWSKIPSPADKTPQILCMMDLVSSPTEEASRGEMLKS